MKSPDAERQAPEPSQADLLAEIGHELRSPLTSILAFADALQYEVFGPLTDSQKQALAGINTCVTRQTAQIRDLIELRKFECGLQALAPVACEVSSIVVKAVAQHQSLATERKVRLITEVLPVDLQVSADPKHLLMLVASLVQTGLMAAGKSASVRLAVSLGSEAADLQISVIVAQSGGEPTGTEILQCSATDFAVEQRLRKLSPIAFALAGHVVALHGGRLTCLELGDVIRLNAALPI